jgi:NOL1/NOP2/sun family putative RNA methylase
MAGGQIVRVRPSPEVRTWSQRHSFSPELVARWVAFHPRPERLLESLLRPTPRYVRVNTLRARPEKVRAALEERGFELEPVVSLSSELPVFRVVKEPFALASTPEHLMGDLYVQDLASLTAPAALQPVPGDLVLDMAAAPGGKTTAIAQMAGDKASLLAVDPVPHRAAALSANLRRLGVTGAAVKLGRGELLETDLRFDRILLDAPCTGEGVLPRDPNRRTGDLREHEELAVLQRRLVDRAVSLLRPGGLLVYSSCTFSPEECEGVVAHAVAQGMVPEPLPFDDLDGVPLDPGIVEAGPHVYGDAVRHVRRVYPDRHRALGFFVARLRHPGDAGKGGSLREGVLVPDKPRQEAESESDEEESEDVGMQGSRQGRVGVEA